MKILLTSILTLVGSVNHAQNTNLSVYVSGSPDMCYRWVPKNESHLVQYKNHDLRFGYHFALGANYALNEKYTLFTELRFSSMGFRTKEMGYELDPNSDWTSRRYDVYDFIEMPLGASYTLGSSKLQGVVSAFISPGLLFRYNRRLDVYPTDQKDFSTNEINDYGAQFRLFCGIRCGIKYPLSDRLTLLVQPELTTAFWADYYSARLWSLGVNSSVIIHL